MKSIIQTEKKCYVCETTQGLHLHHCIYGSGKRKLADKYKLTVWLCGYHHNMSDAGVHFDKELDTHLKQLAQTRFEETYNESFLKVFGRNYLD